MIRWLVVFISSLAVKVAAQDFHSIQFVPKFGNHHLELNTEYTLGNDKITFTNLSLKFLTPPSTRPKSLSDRCFRFEFIENFHEYKEYF